MTIEVLKSGCDEAATGAVRGTPAALQMASHIPPSLRSGWASGSQIKPANESDPQWNENAYQRPGRRP
jgi:hypothetical protein